MFVGRAIVLVLAISLAVSAQSVTIDVPGTGTPWLAAAPAGTTVYWTAIEAPTAPLNSPVLVNLAFRSGEALSFAAAGFVQDPSYSPGSIEPNIGPDGSTLVGDYTAYSQRGLSGIIAPFYGLMGVFTRNSTDLTTPPSLDFRAGARELTTISPMLQQVFYIGQGKNRVGNLKSFIVPEGATRLYLGVFGGRSKITGAFRVTVSISDLRGYFPQVADGGSWRTVFTLVNTGVNSAQYRLKLLLDSDADFALPLSPGSAPLEGTIPVGGSVDIVSRGNPQEITKQGWAVLSGSANIDGMAVFRSQTTGVPDFEAVVLLTHSERELWLPFDQTAGFTTGIAVANAEGVAQTITAEFLDDRGVQVGRSAIPLGSFAHTAFALGSTAAPTGSPATGKGVVHIKGEGTQRLVLLGLRFNWTGPFTSLPAVKPQ